MAKRQGITRKTLTQAQRDERKHVRALARTKRGGFDSFNNWSINLGMGTNNALSGGTYGFNPITRIRTLLEWMYRGNWLSLVAVDGIAKDMTREGYTIKAEDLEPEDTKKIYTRLARTQTMSCLCTVISWARLYGGACGYIQVYGQDPATPLRPETVPVGGYRGLMVLDRWMLEPQLNDLVEEGPEAGLPRFYRVTSDAPGLKGRLVHHSRMIRLIGVKLPYWQAMMENYWGLSIFEPLYDRMVAFDSATMGAAQLAYKAHVRTLKIGNYRQILAQGGPTFNGLMKMLELVRTGQSVEGLTVIDGQDEMETQQTGALTGIGEIVLKLGEQIGGGLGVPMTKLFGQSPGGLNSTGESDIRGYYDGIEQKQKDELSEPMHGLTRVVAYSEGVGDKLGDDFDIEWNPLWQMTDAERGEIDEKNTGSALALFESGNISAQQLLKEVVHRGQATNTWQTSITAEDIEAADDELPEPEMPAMPADPNAAPGSVTGATFGAGGQQTGQVKPGGALRKELRKSGDRKVTWGVHQWARDLDPKLLSSWAVDRDSDGYKRYSRYDIDPVLASQPGSFMGLPVVVEHSKGTQRWEGAPRLPAHYGYIPGVGSAEGETEWMDCMVGDATDAPYAFVLDHYDRDGKFEEHKIMIGFHRLEDALRAHRVAYDGTGCAARGVCQMTIPQVQQWMARDRNQRIEAMVPMDRRAA